MPQAKSSSGIPQRAPLGWLVGWSAIRHSFLRSIGLLRLDSHEAVIVLPESFLHFRLAFHFLRIFICMPERRIRLFST